MKDYYLILHRNDVKVIVLLESVTRHSSFFSDSDGVI